MEMEDWALHNEDMNIFSDHVGESYSNDGEKTFWKRKLNDSGTKSNAEDENSHKKRKDSADSLFTESNASTAIDKEQRVWSIEDDTFFYPLGIANHCIAGVNKSVIITWSDYSIINFVIKKIVNTNQTKTKKVRFDVPPDEMIKEIQILEFNTLLLLESGKVHYFSSAKSMHSLDWLDGIRCMGRTLDGFCVIRLTSNQKLALELYEDTINMGKMSKGPIQKQYDITYDDLNLFNCKWEDDKFVIFAVEIQHGNEEFIEHLIANSFKFKDQKEIYIFAVSGGVFVLIPDNTVDGYHIKTIFSYASNILLIKVDQRRKFSLIFLECGSVDIWYWSTATERMLNQRYNSGTVFESFSYSDNRASFFFTDDNQVVELHFNYNAIKDKFIVKETYKAIPGILACTWIETLEMLVCLDCNNIFHKVSFEEHKQAEDQDQDNGMHKASDIDSSSPRTSVTNYEKFHNLYELTPKRVEQLMQKGNYIEQLKNLPKEIYDGIEKEYLKQQLIAINDKRNYYSKKIAAQFKFVKQFTRNYDDAASLFLFAAKANDMHEDNKYFALIELDIGCKNIFQNSHWQLNATCGNTTVHIFPLPKNAAESKIKLVLPLERQHQELIPDIQLYLYAFISHGSMDHATISIPINLNETCETYKYLFLPPAINLKTTTSIWNAYGLNELFAQFNIEDAQIDLPENQYTIELPPNNFEFETIKKCFKYMQKDQSTMTNDFERYNIRFLDSNISLSWDSSQRILCFKSKDAAALYYFKLYIFLCCDEKQLPDLLSHYSNYQQAMMKLQCSLETCYGDLSAELNMDNAGEVIEHRGKLQQSYKKIRQYLINI